MTNEEYAKIISKNLVRLIYESGKTQKEIAQDLGVSTSALSSWVNGERIPKMSKIDMMCNYFGCKRTDIMEEHHDKNAIEVPQVIIDALNTRQADRLLQYARVILEMERLEDLK